MQLLELHGGRQHPSTGPQAAGMSKQVRASMRGTHELKAFPFLQWRTRAAGLAPQRASGSGSGPHLESGVSCCPASCREQPATMMAGGALSWGLSADASCLPDPNVSSNALC